MLWVRGMLVWCDWAFDSAGAAVRWGWCGVCRSWWCAWGLGLVSGWRSVGEVAYLGLRSNGCRGFDC